MLEYSYGLETRASEYGLFESAAVSAALCLVWPTMINKLVKYTPSKVPKNGNMNLRKLICAAESSWTPIQKEPPMQTGMITNSTSGNLIRNSHQLVLMHNSFLNIMTTPKKALRKLQ